MFRLYQSAPAGDETLLEKVCRLARARNKAALTAMVKQGVCLGEFDGQFNAVMQLAYAGDKRAVDFLINEFHVNPQHAVEAYSLGGHIDFANELLGEPRNLNTSVMKYAAEGNAEMVLTLIVNKADEKCAIRGYIFGNHHDEVDALLRNQEGDLIDKNIRHAILIYASAGQEEHVNRLIRMDNNEDIKFAIIGYAKGNYINKEINALINRNALADAVASGFAIGGHVDMVNEMLIEHKNVRTRVLQGYANAELIEHVNRMADNDDNCLIAAHGYFSGQNVTDILKIMTLSPNDKLRQYLMNDERLKHKSLYGDRLIKLSDKIRNIMNEYQLDYPNAKALITERESAEEWILNGRQLIDNGTFSAEIFIHITSFVLGRSSYDTSEIINRVVGKSQEEASQSSNMISP